MKLTNCSINILHTIWIMAFVILGVTIRIPELARQTVSSKEAPHLLHTAALGENDPDLSCAVDPRIPETLFHQISAPLIQFFSSVEHHHHIRTYRWTTFFFSFLGILCIPLLGLRRRKGLFENEIGMGIAILLISVYPINCLMSRNFLPDNSLIMIMGGLLIAARAYVQWPGILLAALIGALMAIGIAINPIFIWCIIALIPAIMIGAGWNRLTVYWRTGHILMTLFVLLAITYCFIDTAILSLFKISYTSNFILITRFIQEDYQRGRLIYDIPILLLVCYTFIWSWLRDERRSVRLYSLYLLTLIILSCFIQEFWSSIGFLILQVALILAGTGVGILFQVNFTRCWLLYIWRIGLISSIVLLTITLTRQSIVDCHTHSTFTNQLTKYKSLIITPPPAYNPGCLILLDSNQRMILRWYLRSAPSVVCEPSLTDLPKTMTPGMIFVDEQNKQQILKHFPNMTQHQIELSPSDKCLIFIPKERLND